MARTLAQVIAEGDALLAAKNNEIETLKATHKAEIDYYINSNSMDMKRIQEMQNILVHNRNQIAELDVIINQKDTDLIEEYRKVYNSHVIIAVLSLALIASFIYSMFVSVS